MILLAEYGSDAFAFCEVMYKILLIRGAEFASNEICQ